MGSLELAGRAEGLCWCGRGWKGIGEGLGGVKGGSEPRRGEGNTQNQLESQVGPTARGGNVTGLEGLKELQTLGGMKGTPKIR